MRVASAGADTTPYFTMGRGSVQERRSDARRERTGPDAVPPPAPLVARLLRDPRTPRRRPGRAHDPLPLPLVPDADRPVAALGGDPQRLGASGHFGTGDGRLRSASRGD